MITDLDLKAAGITSVIWAMGCNLDFSWVKLPVFDEYGCPVQKRVITDRGRRVGGRNPYIDKM